LSYGAWSYPEEEAVSILARLSIEYTDAVRNRLRSNAGTVCAVVLDGAPRDEPDDEDMEVEAWTESDEMGRACKGQGRRERRERLKPGVASLARWNSREWNGQVS
jgi:hypothetical protein